LADELLRQILRIANARHDHTGGDRDDQRRNLRHQAIADGQQGIGLGRRAKIQIVLQDADEQTAKDVDEHDQNTGDGIAANELRRAVHRAEKICLFGDRCAPLARIVFTDQTGIEVGVDRHLLARHGIQGETCRHFSDPASTLGNDHEIDDHQNRKDDDTDGVIAADQKMPEGLDHPTRRPRTSVPFKQNDARRSNVERQA